MEIATEQPAPRRTNHDLDTLAVELGEFKDAVGHSDMHRGERGMKFPDRAAAIEKLVRHLSRTAPARVDHVALDPASTPIGELLAEIRDAREAILPRRKQHHPKFHVDINGESESHIAFMRKFTTEWRDGDKEYMKQHFPHLRHAARAAYRMLGIYDLVEQLETDYSRATVDHPLDQEQRRALYDQLQDTTTRILEKWPPLAAVDERAKSYMPDDMFARYSTALNRVRYELNRMPAAMMPNRTDPVDDLQKAINELRYESCAFAQRFFKQIEVAYQADAKLLEGKSSLLGARDPLRQQLPMLEDVYAARWSLLADDIYARVNSNRALLETHGTLAKQTRAEAETERQAAQKATDPDRQGSLDL